jgi:DNA-binding CsgD family transcriptional regulator
LDQLATGVIVTDSGGRVVEMNRPAARIARLEDGLTIRNGRLGTARIAESERLSAFIAVAASGTKTPAAVGRMRIGRHTGRQAYLLTVAPLGDEPGSNGSSLAMVLIADPEEPSPSERELAQSFGLSPAESRLAAALMAGKRLSDVTIESGVQISTLRTQLTSINKKVGVKRQADLVRVFSLIPAVGAGTAETK